MIAAHGGTALLKIVANISGYVERLRTAPGEEIGRWGRFLRFQLQLWRYCARRLWINNLTAMSAALSFRTIFALIPTIVLAALFLKSVGVLEDGKRSLRQFLETTGFTQIVVVEQPAGGEAAPGADGAAGRSVNVANEIEQIVGQVESKLTVERLGPIGVVLLIWTALGLLTAMEQSLNRVFGAERARSAAKRLLLYWGVLTLGPLAGYLVMPAMAGLLIVTAWTMSEPRRWPERLRMRSADRLLLFLTIALTVLSDLTVAIAVGTALGLAQRLMRRGVEPADWNPRDH